MSATATRLISRKPASPYASSGDMCATSRPNRTMPLYARAVAIVAAMTTATIGRCRPR
ncbi:Uncharacterised protein [Mycobacteroides abscessus]|nr:Uncharacterised protein [Mycobacteroides abscessus]